MNIDPPPANGINLWMLSTARKCQLAGLAAWEAEQRIMEHEGGARRRFKNGEVTRAVERAYNTVLAESTIKREQKPKWNPSKTNPKFREFQREITEHELWHVSPWRMEQTITQQEMLKLLFPDQNGLICVGQSAFKFYTARLDQFKDLTKCQFIVPCYMSKRIGITQDGKPSMHCLDNCGPRRFYVCDFDEPKSSDHPSIIWHLMKLFDLVLVISSGGKSLHAWFNVPDQQEDSFWKIAVEMGADPALMRNRSSFVRLPFGMRDNGREQYAIYFNPDKIPQ